MLQILVLALNQQARQVPLLSKDQRLGMKFNNPAMRAKTSHKGTLSIANPIAVNKNTTNIAVSYQINDYIRKDNKQFEIYSML